MANVMSQGDTIVVIVNWQRPQDTLECLKSVLSTELPGLQVLVVDNGSQDDSCELIRKQFRDEIDKRLHFLELPSNLGFAGGYNAGIAYARSAKAENIFLLNNDTVLDSLTIPALVASQWEVGVPKILYYHDPHKIWAAGAYLRKFPPGVTIIGMNKRDGPDYSLSRPLSYATGCALLLRGKVLDAFEGFDPFYENYMEDYDFTHRLSMAGIKMGYVPEARVWHKVSQTLGSGSPKLWRYMGRNAVFFYGRYFSKRMLYTFISWSLIRATLKGEFSSIPHYWQGVKDGFRLLGEQSQKVGGG